MSLEAPFLHIGNKQPSMFSCFCHYSTRIGESANLAYVLLVALLPIVAGSLIRRCVRRRERGPENDWRRDTTDDVAGINPPGGLWQDNQKEQVAGTAIFAYRKQAAFYVFLVFNTLAFTTSAFTIFCFTQGFPFSPEIRLAVVSVVVTYACAVSAIIPPESANLAYVLLVALLPIVVLSWIRRRVRGE
ncbi:hypothetical protein SLEP1_g14069 [Rubroshorea leprosula]|uniref:PGG domain-containing protein n=1 Tax=Rubroshorea leprosula TaxID=152421 RepID=A0AAV5ISI0_9ROSI|nr:hypothetical protein SLEP1_g14069 [Rubroshorea leprosula]